MAHNQEIKSEISQVLELVGKDFKIVINMFQDQVKDSYSEWKKEFFM